MSHPDEEELVALAMGEPPDAELVVVNPPRRGLGPELCAALEASTAATVVYSSCHSASLARDLLGWKPKVSVEEGLARQWQYIGAGGG